MSPDVLQPDPEPSDPVEVLDLEELRAFPPAWEIFCAELANGSTIVLASARAGFSESNGNKLTRRPEIVARIRELLALRRADGGLVSRMWAECQLVRIVQDSMEVHFAEYDEAGNQISPFVGADRARAESAVMNLARLKGWIVERKQSMSAKVDLGQVGSQQMSAALDAALLDLAPAERARVKAIAAGGSKSASSRGSVKVPANQTIDSDTSGG